MTEHIDWSKIIKKEPIRKQNMNRKIFNDLADYIMDTYDVNIIDKKDISFEELVDHIDKIVVGEYFGSTGVGGNYWSAR